MKNDCPSNTKRIQFRCWSSSDIMLAKHLWGCPDVTKLISANGFTADDIILRLNKEIYTMNNHGVQYWPIFQVSDGSHLGCCGLRPCDSDPKIYELGFHLNKEFWGMGFAKESAKEVIRYAFFDLNISRLIAGHHPENTGSAQLLHKLGFEFSHNEFYKPTELMHPMYFLQSPVCAVKDMV